MHRLVKPLNSNRAPAPHCAAQDSAAVRFRAFWLGAAALGLLASCGAEGAPTKPGITVSGEAQIGITSN